MTFAIALLQLEIHLETSAWTDNQVCCPLQGLSIGRRELGTR